MGISCNQRSTSWRKGLLKIIFSSIATRCFPSLTTWLAYETESKMQKAFFKYHSHGGSFGSFHDWLFRYKRVAFLNLRDMYGIKTSLAQSLKVFCRPGFNTWTPVTPSIITHVTSGAVNWDYQYIFRHVMRLLLILKWILPPSESYGGMTWSYSKQKSPKPELYLNRSPTSCFTPYTHTLFILILSFWFEKDYRMFCETKLLFLWFCNIQTIIFLLWWILFTES